MPWGTDRCQECGTYCPDGPCPECFPEPLVLDVAGEETELVSPELIRRYRELAA